MNDNRDTAPASPNLDERAQEVLAALETEDEGPGGEPDAGPEDPPAPISWSKEEKRLFEQLPPELKAVVSRREAERERFLSTRNQELARLQKELDGERARLAGQLDALIAEAERDPIVVEGARLDWERMRRENPALFARKWPAYQERAAAIEAARAHRAQTSEAALAERRQREHAAIAARLPEWHDASRREAIVEELRSFLAGEGYSPAEIATIDDHRSFLIALDAMRWRRQQEAKRGLAKKKVTPPPRTQKPGATDDEAPSASRLAALKQRALKTGKLDDRAAYVLAALDEEA
jgi:hypothetical protein